MPYAEVIGDPIDHSKSPLIHNRWIAQLALPCEYRATRVRPTELSAFFEHRRADPDWRGCNLTIPHKEAALSDVDDVDDDVREIGAANCVVPRREGLIGHNSDVDGVAAALDAIAIERRTVGVVGGGGAARAALHYLSRRKVGKIALLVRNPDRAQRLYRTTPPGTLVIGALADAPMLLAGAAAIINASPLGMRGGPQMPSKLLSAVGDQADCALFDMVYDPITTPFLSAGRSQRIDGLSMLIGQAARAFELFFGVSPPLPDQRLHKLLTQG